MDFTKANLNGGTLPTVLDGQGFTVGCGACPQYITFKFDANATPAMSTVSRSGMNMSYVIGVQNVTDLKDLAKAVFDGVSATSYATRSRGYTSVAKDTSTTALIDENHNLFIEMNGADFYISKDSFPMEFIDKGVIVGSSTDPTTGPTGTISIQNPTTLTIRDVTYTKEEKLVHHDGKPLIIHTGTKANQHLRVYINSMHPIALGINRATIVTRDKAVESLGIIDAALEYSLNEATRMGAYQSRLTQTESNLVTSDENTVASKSAIMDTDMAKAMVQYTKSSVLTQSAQLMLAQANQNSSSVLSLLQ